MITGKWNRMQPDCQKFHAIYKGITRKSGENDGDVLEAAKAEYSACNKGKKFAYEHGWRVLKKHPKWDAAYHFDSEDHTEIFGPDARPRPPGKTRPAKKTKSETTESSAVLEVEATRRRLRDRSVTEDGRFEKYEKILDESVETIRVLETYEILEEFVEIIRVLETYEMFLREC
ncbi:hypothetical protein Tco_0906075 [Tanacetum coccineum]